MTKCERKALTALQEMQALVDDMMRFVGVMALRGYRRLNEAPLEAKAAIKLLVEMERRRKAQPAPRPMYPCPNEGARCDGFYTADLLWWYKPSGNSFGPGWYCACCLREYGVLDIDRGSSLAEVLGENA